MELNLVKNRINLTKYKILVFGINIISIILFTYVNYSAFYTLVNYGLFVAFELVGITTMVFLLILVMKVDTILSIERQKLMVKDKFFKIQDESLPKSINDSLRHKQSRKNQM